MPLAKFTLPQDIDVLKDIIPQAFQYPENESWNVDEGQAEAIQTELETVKRLWPIFRAIGVIWPPIREALLGYIWIEDGQPVGVCNVSRRGGSQQWELGNVAVLPDYRRRGIARQLVQSCVELAIEHGAQQITLDVIDGNTPAYALYQQLGFEHFSGQYELVWDHESTHDAPNLPDGYRLEPLKPTYWRTRYEFIKRITPAQLEQFEPVTESRFRMPLVIRTLRPVIRRLMGFKGESYHVLDAANNVVAIARYRAQRDTHGSNEIRLDIDPEHAILQRLLLCRMLAELAAATEARRTEFQLTDWQNFEDTDTPFADLGMQTKAHYHRLGYTVPHH